MSSTTAEHLKGLSGTGEAETDKHINGRPSARKDELVQKKIVPQAAYDTIKDKVVAKQE